MGTEGSKAADAHGVPHEDALLRWYPRAWRARYGEDLIALLDDEYGGHPPALVRLGLVTGGLRERARQAAITGDSAPPVDGVRAGALMVLAAWSAFVVAGASFAKFSEHFDEALPHTMGAHHIPDLAFTVLQTVAGVVSVLVVAGALLAAPDFVRFLQAGGWSSVRGHFLRALACTGVTIASTVPLVVWAHHLTAHQRNGGLHLVRGDVLTLGDADRHHLDDVDGGCGCCGKAIAIPVGGAQSGGDTGRRRCCGHGGYGRCHRGLVGVDGEGCAIVPEWPVLGVHLAHHGTFGSSPPSP